jgi:hypothetical protein
MKGEMMSTLLKNRHFKILTYFVTLIFVMAGTVQSYSASRIIPSEKVEIYSGGQLKQVLQEEAPLPVGPSMHSSGRTGLRMNNVYMVAEDGCTLSILEDSTTAKVKIDNGLLFFAATPTVGQMLFDTPAGSLSTRQISLKASDQQPVLKAFVDVNDKETTVGVLEGGALTLTTPEGVKTVNEGKQIVLSQAGAAAPAQTGQQAPASDNAEALSQDENNDDKIPAGYYVGGAAALGLLALGALAMGGSSGDTPGPASPATP